MKILPFHTNSGVTHYYGVGAYRRSVLEVRNHNVKFTPESLGFANVPIAKTRNEVLDKQIPVTHHPRWKERTPRDTGTGWDFEDVRDHYLKELFSIDPQQLRSFDNEKYLSLSEIVSGEMMSQVFAEWRSNRSRCSGGLIWFLKDFLPGAGWGILDSYGIPKACYYYLKRRWQPISVCITDESLNGLDIHVVNENNKEIAGKLVVTLLNDESVVIAVTSSNITIEGRSVETVSLDELLGSFYDATYSYRFGPAKHSVVAVQLIDKNGVEISADYYFPLAQIPRAVSKTELTATIVDIDNSNYELELETDKFLYAVNIDIPGYLASDNYFHMVPGLVKRVGVELFNNAASKPKGYVSALNSQEEVKIKVISN